MTVVLLVDSCNIRAICAVRQFLDETQPLGNATGSVYKAEQDVIESWC